MISTTTTIAARLRRSDTIAQIRDPRGFIAWKLHGAAMPMLALAHRLCDDIPSDFHEEWEDGRRYGERAASSKYLELLQLGYESGVYASDKAATR